MTFRYSCCSLPALRQDQLAFLMCSPLAHASISFGLDLLTCMTKVKSCICTLPAPPAAAVGWVPVWVAPQLEDSISISFLCLSVLALALNPIDLQEIINYRHVTVSFRCQPV